MFLRDCFLIDLSMFSMLFGTLLPNIHPVSWKARCTLGFEVHIYSCREFLELLSLELLMLLIYGWLRAFAYMIESFVVIVFCINNPRVFVSIHSIIDFLRDSIICVRTFLECFSNKNTCLNDCFTEFL